MNGFFICDILFRPSQYLNFFLTIPLTIIGPVTIYASKLVAKVLPIHPFRRLKYDTTCKLIYLIFNVITRTKYLCILRREIYMYVTVEKLCLTDLALFIEFLYFDKTHRRNYRLLAVNKAYCAWFAVVTQAIRSQLPT